MAVLDGVGDWKVMKNEMTKNFQKKGLSKYYEYSELLVKGPGKGSIKAFFYKLGIVAAEIDHDLNDVKVRIKRPVPLALVDGWPLR